MLSRVKISAVKQQDNRITIRSIGAKTIPGKLSNKKPDPMLYKCPLRSTISPIYISSVITEAEIAGIQTDTSFRFPRRNDPTNTPAVTPNRIKNTVISAADRGDTRMLPSLQKAVKQARIQRPRKTTEQMDCKIKDLQRFLSPFLIICPNPYKLFKMVTINKTEII